MWTFTIYPNEHKYVYNRGLQLLKNSPVVVTLGVFTKLTIFTPKSGLNPIYSEANIVTKGNEFLNISVTYRVGCKQKKKIFQNSKKIMCGCRITPQIGRRGTFLPITKSNNSIIFRPNLVIHEQDSMPIN